jgi:RNA polymerase sigma factor (sigma-70 family)
MKDFNDVVLEAQKGNQRAMDIVIKHMYKCLYPKVAKMWRELPGGHTAEDMVQFAMIEVLRAIKTYNGKGYAKKWLWLYVKSAINNEARYLYYDKRKVNMNAYSMDKALNANDAEKEITLAHVIPCTDNIEQEALDNVYVSDVIKKLRSNLSKTEINVMNYMLLDYANKDIISATGYKPKAVDNAKMRIKSKAKKYLVAM